MDNIENRSQKSLMNILYFAFIFSALYIFALSIKLNLNIFLQVIIILILGGMVKFFILNPLILYIIAVCTFIGSIIINHYVTPIIFVFIERAYLFLSNIINNIRGLENIAPENILPFWSILVIILSIFTAFIIFKNKSILFLIPIYIPIFLFYWYIFLDQAYIMIALFLACFLLLYGLKKYNSAKVASESNQNFFNTIYNPWIRTVSTYVLLIVLISLIVPKGLNYIQWGWLQNKVYSTFPFVEDLRSYDTYTRGKANTALFNFSSTGYQGDPTRLGGPVILSPKRIMTVLTKEPTYLRGNIKQIYTGNIWESVNGQSNNYPLMQDFSGLSQEEKGLYYEIDNILVTYHDFSSSTFFSPYKPLAINLNQDSWIIVGQDDLLTSSTGIFDNESYNISIARPLPYGKIIATGIDKRINEINDLDVYLQIPTDKITERTKLLVSDIVQGLDSDFEKAKAIESFLRENYNYNLEVDEIPEGREFIDYFLFDERQGYCTYYATTMAIMLRLEGIPSRYVEGYLAKDMIKPNIYEVKQENAHAWVEAFIEPVGWMTFEATPAYSIQSRLEGYQFNDAEIENDILKTDREPRTPRTDIDKEEIEDLLDIGIGDNNINTENENKTTNSYKDIIPIVILALLLILPIRLLIGLFKYYIKENKSKNLSSNKRIIYLYQEIINLTSLLGYPQNKGETHYEYSRRIAYKFYDHNKKGIVEITDIFVRSKYSSILATDEDVQDLEKYRDTLERRLRNYLGIRKYYYKRYLEKG